jgi:hypothetical protein
MIETREQQEEREEFRQEERLLLRDWAGMPGWKVAQRRLHRRISELAAQVMNDSRLDENGLREKQVEYRLLLAFVTDPVKFVLGKE